MNEKQKEELETAKSQLQGKTQEVTQLQSQMAKLSNIVDQYKSEMETLKKNVKWVTGLILGLHPANERRRYFCNDVSHWLGANLESALSKIELAA